MKLYEERRAAPGRPTHPQYRQVLLNEAGEVVWSCIVWADSVKSEDEADKLMMDFINSRNVPIELRDFRYGVWQSFNQE